MFVATSLTLMFWWACQAAPPAPVDWVAELEAGLQDEQSPKQTAESRQSDEPPPPPGDGPGRHRGERGGPGRWREFLKEPPPTLPPELIEQTMEVLREKLPEFARRMEKLQKENPQRFDRAIKMIMPMVMEYRELSERDQKLADTIIQEFKIEHQLRELSKQYQAAAGDAEKQAGYEEKIRELVRQQTDIRLLRQEARLKEFAERLEKQRRQLERERQEVAEQRSNIDDLVAGRIEEVKAGKFKERFPQRFGRHGKPGSLGEGPGPGGPPPEPGRDEPRHRGPHGDRAGMHPPPTSQCSPPSGHHEDDDDPD